MSPDQVLVQMVEKRKETGKRIAWKRGVACEWNALAAKGRTGFASKTHMQLKNRYTYLRPTSPASCTTITLPRHSVPSNLPSVEVIPMISPDGIGPIAGDLPLDEPEPLLGDNVRLASNVTLIN